MKKVLSGVPRVTSGRVSEHGQHWVTDNDGLGDDWNVQKIKYIEDNR